MQSGRVLGKSDAVARRRRSESELEEIVTAFRDLPLIWAVVAAPVFVIIFFAAIPALATLMSGGQPSSVGAAIVGSFVRAFSPWIGGILAVGSLFFGLVGAGERWLARRRVGRTSATRTSMRTCPICGNSMVLRTATRGANAGNHFWGCSSYPSCRKTLPA